MEIPCAIPDINVLPWLQLTSRKPLWLDLQPVDIKSQWMHNWKSAQVVNYLPCPFHGVAGHYCFQTSWVDVQLNSSMRLISGRRPFYSCPMASSALQHWTASPTKEGCHWQAGGENRQTWQFANPAWYNKLVPTMATTDIQQAVVARLATGWHQKSMNA